MNPFLNNIILQNYLTVFTSFKEQKMFSNLKKGKTVMEIKKEKRIRLINMDAQKTAGKQKFFLIYF